MGDFNYGGTYVPADKLDRLDIDKSLKRLISKTDGTTVKPFNPTPQDPSKPYDRIYAASPKGTTIQMEGNVDKFNGGLTPEKVPTCMW